MTSVQRLIANDRSVLAAAVLTASSVASSRAIRRTGATRTGNGLIKLVGDYAGAEDATYDIEIAAGGSVKRASAPVFAGVGNGVLTVSDVAAATAGAYVFTLSDLGVATQAARLRIEDILIQAKTPGAAGNLLRLTVTPALTQAATAHAVLEDWPAGQETMSGGQYDFAGLPLTATGEMDANTPRIQFTGDPAVYRPYRAYVEGAWRYGLTPAPAKAIAAGAEVFTVSGGYGVTVTNGTITETYANQVTFHDMLSSLAASALVTVVGTVTADRQPGGMAIRDIPLRTAAWLLSSSGTPLSGVDIADDADSEVVSIECVNTDLLNAERWRVTGSRTGALGTATTGAPFTSTVLDFVVPATAATGDVNDWHGAFAATSRIAGETLPDVCLRNFTPGINARPGSVTFRYEKRPDNACSCETAALLGSIDPTCLGLEEDEMPIVDTEYTSRLQALYLWRSGVVSGSIKDGINHDPNLTAIADAVVPVFSSVLAQVRDVPAALAAWDDTWSVMVSELGYAVGYGGYALTFTSGAPSATAIVNGGSYDLLSSGASLGASVSCGGMSYVIRAIKLGGVDYTGVGGTLWPLSGVPTGLTLDDADITISGVSGGNTYTLTVNRYPSGSILLTKDKFYRNNELGMDFVVTDIRRNDGDGGALSPVWVSLVWDNTWDTSGAEIRKTDGTYTVTLRRYNGQSLGANLVAANVATAKAKYTTMLDYALALAGKFDASSGTSGDDCWRDSTDGYWWVDTSGRYLPAFTNSAWVSTWKTTGESTREFGFFIAVDCTDRLKEGDAITLTIGSVDGSRPYAKGDVATLSIVTAGPAWLAGGVDGDDTHVWRVSGPAGALADYAVPVDGGAIPDYTAGGLVAGIAISGIAFALGDTFGFSVESSQFRWRKNGGVWSGLANITGSDVALADGLAARLAPGVAPSFVGGDVWHYAAEQINAPSHLRAPHGEYWAWSGASATLTAALGSSQAITALALADYALPAGAVVTLEGGNGVTWPNSQTMNISGPVSVAFLPVTWNVTHLRITVANAGGGRIGWLWAGQPLSTTHSATTCRITRAYAITRGSAINPATAYLGRGRGGEISWAEHLEQTDLDGILTLLDHVKAYSEPLILVPHHLTPAEAALVRVDVDAVDVADVFEFQPNATSHRRLSVSLPFAPVMA